MINIVEFKREYASKMAKLYGACGEKFSEKLVEYWLKARKYVKVLIAVDEKDKVLGKVTLDLAYRPYAEIVNLMVHPDFRRQGIGTMLLEKCLELAENSGYCIQYLMTSIENKIAHRLYAKYGFIPTIIPRKRSSGRDMWLHRFSKNTFVKEFLLKHPFAEKVLSKNRVYFEERKLYRVTLRDIISDNYLLLCFEGQPGQTPEGTMPRITGVCIKYSKVHLSIVVEEEQKYLTKGEACFRLKIINKGLKKINFINIGFMSAPGIEVYLPKIEEIKEHSKKEIEVKCIFSKEFDVPLLSFNTAVVAICMNLDKVFQNPLLVSAGFEISR